MVISRMFDAKRFLADHFRTPAEAVAQIRAHGLVQPPKEDAVRKWFARGSLPAEWLAVAMETIRWRSGAVVNIRNYIRADTTAPDIECSVLD